MAAVFPENMDRLNADDVAGSLTIIENYIRYMKERVEFSTKNVTRSVSEAGISSAQIYEMVITLGNTLSALQSVVNGMSGQISDTNSRITAVQSELTGMKSTVTEMQEQISELTTRVEALEGNGGNA